MQKNAVFSLNLSNLSKIQVSKAKMHLVNQTRLCILLLAKGLEIKMNKGSLKIKKCALFFYKFRNTSKEFTHVTLW